MAERRTADSRRREIADAALRVIAEQGLGRFTALAIAREVGVSDAALFRHFQTKEEIILAAIDRLEEILFAGFPPAERDPLERLGSFFRQRVAVIAASPGVARLVASDALEQVAPSSGAARVAELRRRSVGFVRACLEEARREELLGQDIEPAEAEVLVIGAILALTRTRGAASRPSQDGSLADRTWRALERLLRVGDLSSRPMQNRRRRTPC